MHRDALVAASIAALCLLAFGGLIALTSSDGETRPISVSVRDVAIDPYAVDGKLVRLVGLLHHSAEGDVMYWHESDIERSLHSHAVAVQIATPPLGRAESAPQGHVWVEGIFKADPVEASGFNGAVLNARLVAAR